MKKKIGMSRKQIFPVTTGLLTLLVVLLLTALPATAQQPTPPPLISDDQVNAIAKEMYCPVCENVPLDVCPTQACAQWRELIREKLAAGWSEKQISDYFVEQYGARVLATPPATGFYWMIYLVPPAVILLGLFILYRALSAWKQPAPAMPGLTQRTGSTAPATDEYIQRVEEELKKQK